MIALALAVFSLVSPAKTEAPQDYDIQYVMYLGTNDKDTYEPFGTPEEAKAKADEVLTRHFEGFTIQDAMGGVINVPTGATLAVSGIDLVWRGTVTNNGTVNSSAEIALVEGDARVVNNGTFINSAVFAVAPGASFTGGTVNNTGTIIVSDGGSFTPNFADGVVIRSTN